MPDPLQHFRDVILVSGISSVVLALLLLLLTRWRAHWRRLLDAEGAFWKRLGLVGRWTAPLRRIEESRLIVAAIGALLVLHLLLLISAAGAWAYFAPRLHKASAPHLPPPAASPRPNKPIKSGI